MPRCIEQNVDWIANLLVHMRQNGHERVEPAPAAEEAWTAEVYAIGTYFLFTRIDSWMTGVNKNLAHKRERSLMAYAGGAPMYRERCNDVAANGYAGFELR